MMHIFSILIVVLILLCLNVAHLPKFYQMVTVTKAVEKN